MKSRIFPIMRKEFIHIVRDPRTLFMVVASPAFMLLMLAYLFTLDVHRFPTAVLDQDKTPLSRRYIAAITSDGTFELGHHLSDLREAEELLVEGKVRLVLVIPPGFAEDARRGRTAQLQVLVDGTNPGAGDQALSQLAARTADFAAHLLSVPSSSPVRTRVWYNPHMTALHSMVPGLLAVVMCMPAFSIAASLTREKEMGTMEGLMATPLRGAELLVGKLLAYLVGGLVSVVPASAVAVLWFEVPLRGSFPLFLSLTALFLLGSLGLSLLLANFLARQQEATAVIFLALFLPSIFVSGLLDPVDRTSWSARLQAYLLPTSHYITIARGIFLKGVGLAELWPSALALTAMGVTTLALSILLFRKKI